MDETLPSKSKYTLTTSFEKSENDKPEALQLSVGKNFEGLNNFRVLGEVMNQGENAANWLKVSAIFTITNTRWLTRITYLQIPI